MDERFETIRLIAGHSMIIGHLPDKIPLAGIPLRSEDSDISSFGLFDNSTPNYNTYYPEVTEDDLHPKDSEFIEPVYRMLSNTVVQHRWNPIEFPEGVLKKSMTKLIGQTVNIDHETAIGNAIGSIKEVEWQESYKLGALEVPAGINAKLKIDGKANPRIARGIMMDPPSIHSNSVTVGFKWRKSHDLPDDEFFNKLGQFDEKGKLIRKIAEDIMFYTETSLVSMGADPFAQKVVDGKIVNPRLTKSRNPVSTKNLSAKEEVKDSYYVFDWKSYEEVASNTITPEDENNSQINLNNTNMDEILRFLETFFKLDENTLTEENYQEELNKIGNEVETLQNRVTELEQPITVEGLTGVDQITLAVKELNVLKNKLPENANIDQVISMSTVGSKALKTLKDETIRLYKLSIGTKQADSNIISMIEKADYESLQSLYNQYDEATDSQFNFTCNDCQSHNVSRASAKPTEESGGIIKTTSELVEKFTGVREREMTIFRSK